MIRIDRVTKRFESFGSFRGRQTTTALDDVKLELERGGVWGVVGPNGAGKTTLFGLLLGFLFPTEGEVTIGGLAPRAYARKTGVAYLPERFRCPPQWTVRGTLRALARLEGLGVQAGARVDEVAGMLGIESRMDEQVGALSHGLLQRLGIAQALLVERELVVLDEPTEGLDPLWRIRFREIMAELNQRGSTVLLASHDLAEVERLAARVVLLDAGRMKEVFTIEAAPSAARGFVLHLAREAPLLTEAFPTATRLEGNVYRVEAADGAELSARLAALLQAGGIVESVTPESDRLEQRVTRALEERS